METTQAKTKTTGKRRASWLLLAVPVLLGAGFFAWQAQAAAGMFGVGPRWGGGGSPEQHKAFMTRRLDRMLDAVKANDSQRSAIHAIAERTFTEMRTVHEQHARLHDQLTAAFAAETVDRGEVEKLRVQATTMMEQGSQALTKGLLDAAQVLTYEQRQQMVKLMQERHGRGHRRF